MICLHTFNKTGADAGKHYREGRGAEGEVLGATSDICISDKMSLLSSVIPTKHLLLEN